MLASRVGRWCGTAHSCRHLATARKRVVPAHPTTTRQRVVPAASRLEPPVVDHFDPDQGVLRNFRGWAESTMAVVQLRKSLPGWAVPEFKLEAATLYEQVSLALAAEDAAKLQELTTPSCFAALNESLQARPSGQRHSWEAQEIVASVKQVRFTHSANQTDRQYAQVTCGIVCNLVWRIEVGRDPDLDPGPTPAPGPSPAPGPALGPDPDLRAGSGPQGPEGGRPRHRGRAVLGE